MEAKKNILTFEGLKRYEEELDELIVVKRREVAEKIKEATEQGDLSENAEYDAAKDEQRDIEARIEEIEKILKNAEVIDEEEVDISVIGVGCQIKILDIENCAMCKSCVRASINRAAANGAPDKSYINVGYRENDFIFRIETDGSMPPKEVLLTACDKLGEKADKFISFSEKEE